MGSGFNYKIITVKKGRPAGWYKLSIAINITSGAGMG